MGKYSHITNTLPKLKEEELDNLPRWKQENPDWQNRVNAKKKEIVEELGAAFGLTALMQVYVEARKDKEAYDELEKKLNIEVEAAAQLLADQFEIEGVNSQRLDTGESVRIQFDPYVKVVDKDKVRNWAKENGLERELQLHWSTLNSHMKDALLKGEAIPEGCEAFTKVKLVMTKK